MSSIDDISNIFGEKILDYSLSLCQGKYDYLDRIPDEILLRIISFLQLKERFVLAQVSKRFRMVRPLQNIKRTTMRLLDLLYF